MNLTTPEPVPPPMLFDPGRHEPLGDAAWDALRVREVIQSIVSDIQQSQVSDGRWRTHPLDDEGNGPPTGYKSLYLGSAGVLWALWYLQRAGAVELAGDPRAGIQEAAVAYLSEPDTGQVVPSYFLGEAGILLVLWRLTGSGRAAERLYELVKSNIPNPTNEALWAAPGTMLAAWHLWEATAEDRWRELFLENVEQLWRTWIFDAQAQCHLWTQDLYGRVVQYLGAGHGFVGNVYPLLKGASLLDAGRREELYDRCVATLRTTQKVDGEGAANWPPRPFQPQPGATGMLMQWCHGAPGVVTALADFPFQRSPELERMLIGAGDAVWKAGPLTKGYGLCHGTAGNGYAFLTLHRRTGDALWLQRARAFAMHSIEQRERMRREYERGRYTLWTGDAGLAVYLWHCHQGLGALPALDAVQ